MVILCDYRGCDRPAVCRIKVGETYVHYCHACLPLVEQVRGIRVVEALPEANLQRPVPTGAQITARELEVLTAIAAGDANHEIAEQLHLSVETVKSHTRHIIEKLGARSRAHAVALGYQHGLLRIVERV